VAGTGLTPLKFTGMMSSFVLGERMPSIPVSASRLSPLDALWQARTIIWVLLVGEALAAMLAIAPGTAGDRLTNFGVASLTIQLVVLTAMGLLYLLRRLLVTVSPPVLAQVSLAALLVSTWIFLLLAWLAVRDVLPPPPGGWQVPALQITAIALIMGLLGLAAFQAQWNARQLAVSAEQAKLQALQARIQPHFLFNTLNTGISLLHAKPALAEQLLLDLSDLFRAALSQRDSLRLDEDLSLARRYLEIEQLRLGERLQLHWDVPDALPPLQVPTLSIQPLAENAIRHGIEPSTSGGEVSIRVGLVDGYLQVSVANTLPPPSARAASGHQVGLSSVRARIHAATQGRGRVETRIADGLYSATIHLPLDAPR
jgi:two-component system sensor histidine kinase AlgZ